MNFTPEQRMAIERLCVSYSTFNRAIHEGSDLGIRVHGRGLLDAQKECGIEMHSPRLILSCIGTSERRDD